MNYKIFHVLDSTRDQYKKCNIFFRHQLHFMKPPTLKIFIISVHKTKMQHSELGG